MLIANMFGCLTGREEGEEEVDGEDGEDGEDESL